MENRPSLFSLSRAEPFRLLFPLGLLISIIAVALWPLFQAHIVKDYPAVMHARLMIEGFMGAFIIGFLGTAAPRMLSAPHLSGKEVGLFAALEVVLTGLHCASLTYYGDAVFLLLLLLFAGSFAYRFTKRQGLPPPNFVLVLFGILSGVVGTVLLLLKIPATYSFAYLLLYQGFVLFPVLGVGIFLFPRFLGLKIQARLPENRTPDSAWKREALRTAAAGLIILGSFFLEAQGKPEVAILIRLGASVYLLPRGVYLPSAPGTLPKALSLSIVFMLLGMVFQWMFPAYRIASFHVMAIGGFGLMVFLVATRVMYGHSGMGPVLKGKTPFLSITVLLTVIALALRIYADFQPRLRFHWIAAGALFWIAGAIVWAIRTTPRVLIPDEED